MWFGECGGGLCLLASCRKKDASKNGSPNTIEKLLHDNFAFM